MNLNSWCISWKERKKNRWKMLCREFLLPHQTFRSKVHWRLQNHQLLRSSKLWESQNKCSLSSFSVEGKVCINNKIDHFVSCTNVETFAIPIETHFNRKHSVEHKILEFLKCVGHLCFVHDGIIARIGGNLNPSCATLPTGFYTSLSSSKCG